MGPTGCKLDLAGELHFMLNIPIEKIVLLTDAKAKEFIQAYLAAHPDNQKLKTSWVLAEREYTQIRDYLTHDYVIYGLYVPFLDAWYVGQTTKQDLHKRLQQHRRKPPTKLIKEALHEYKLLSEFEQAFECVVLGYAVNHRAANRL
ncbi:hypothetical protein CEUSTIGMA_g14034.t1 [Chlamydomonas eustigma]|uniref:GIY-YIG domain-containing protein n=1 Tax=Chlamydomonas eustigma TaxID=1157962 RepID=A0A250XUB3_9CHLO|nr:hypothetical protein CEUSTIGMA_g14034.t1 [Chlamydomonas eustigma]|eukprot:GAX86626.1 hypothetical protein CEUSTIGMA_g14034.t1 [Chlamydomonas eustigma]